MVVKRGDKLPLLEEQRCEVVESKLLGKNIEPKRERGGGMEKEAVE